MNRTTQHLERLTGLIWTDLYKWDGEGYRYTNACICCSHFLPPSGAKRKQSKKLDGIIPTGYNIYVSKMMNSNGDGDEKKTQVEKEQAISHLNVCV